MTEEMEKELRERIRQRRRTLLITVDKRTVMLNLDDKEICGIADANRADFSTGRNRNDWAAGMCRLADMRKDDPLMRGGAMLLCNLNEWTKGAPKSWTVFHIKKGPDGSFDIEMSNLDPDSGGSEYIHPAPPGRN